MVIGELMYNSTRNYKLAISYIKMSINIIKCNIFEEFFIVLYIINENIKI